MIEVIINESEKCHIKGRPTTSDTVRLTRHNLQRWTKQILPRFLVGVTIQQ